MIPSHPYDDEEREQHERDLEMDRADREAEHGPAEVDCVLWAGTLWNTGYGRVRVNDEWMGAHVAAVLSDGRSVPKGHHVHHVCGNKRCVNPAHLEVLTHQEHGDRHRPGVCANGHPRARAVLKANGRVAYCRDCRNEARRARPADDASRDADRDRAARSYRRRRNAA